MPQKKKVVKKEKKKVVKKVVQKQPLLKNSINIKIDLDDDEKKKKPKRKKRQQTQTIEQTDNNVSYVDEQGTPISNEIINKSFSRSFIPQPFSRNSTVIGTSFNESAIMDRVMEKMSKLNTSNQRMNNSVLNQSTIPGPPQLPRQSTLSTIAPASPSVAPQSLNFNLSSPVRPVGITPLQASSLALNRVQQYALSSQNAAQISQDALTKLFKGVTDIEQAEIKKAAQIVKDEYSTQVNEGTTLGAQAMKFKRAFNAEYKGTMVKDEASSIGWQYYKMLP